MEAVDTPQTISWVRKLDHLQVRLIPIVIFCAAALLSVKIVSFWGKVQTQVEKSEFSQKGAGTELLVSTKRKNTLRSSSRFNPKTLNKTEIEVLQSLSKRRDQLRLKEKELMSKESVLAAVESRLDSKLSELKGVQQKIETALDREDESQKAQLDRLVRIYTTMKPKDAANIMQDLSVDLVVQIMGQMQESASSAILSKMDPEAARLITSKLLERRRDLG